MGRPPPDGGLQWPPFRNFGDSFYTYQILLDLKVPKGMAVRTEPHPRFYTDPTDTVPIAVPALIRNWWPMMFFCVFKAPAEGRTHIFRPNEPFAQIIVIPEEANFELEPMSEEEVRRARAAGAAHLRQPPDAFGRYGMDFIDRHRVRRHLPASAPRREGKGAAGVERQANIRASA